MNKSVLALAALAAILPMLAGCNGTSGEISVSVSEKAFDAVVVGIYTPGHSGDIQIDVLYGEEVKFSKTSQTSDEIANVEIKYSDFCTGNGLHTFKVSAGGKEGSGTYDVKKFVASIYVSVSNMTSALKIDLIPIASAYSASLDRMQVSGSGTWWIENPSGTSVKSGSWSLDGSAESATISVDKTFVSGSGQYTVRASFDNSCAKSNTGIREDPNSSNRIALG